MDVTIADTLKFLAKTAENDPALFNAPRREGQARGIEVYPARVFIDVFTRALRAFAKYHGRQPELTIPRKAADYLFKMKFFGYIPVSPNPSDKLNNLEYVPQELRASVTRAKVVWVSEEPVLPDNEDLPPGRYFLKAANDSHAHECIEWPVDLQLRRELEEKNRKWLQRIYGVDWGEWWYAMSKRRVFLEQDLSPQLKSDVEYRIFARRRVLTPRTQKVTLSL